GGVVLLRHEVREERVRQRLVAVRVDAGDIDRGGIRVADVLGEGLAGRAVENDDAHGPGEADEEIVLAALVVMEPANDAPARAREIHLTDRLRERARTGELGEPAPLVLPPGQGDDSQPFDQRPRLPRTKSFTA